MDARFQVEETAAEGQGRVFRCRAPSKHHRLGLSATADSSAGQDTEETGPSPGSQALQVTLQCG